jgi:hypothetical protein
MLFATEVGQGDNWWGTLTAIDVSDTAAPVVAGTLSATDTLFPLPVSCAHLDATTLVVAWQNGTGGVSVVDVSDPSAMVELGTLTFPAGYALPQMVRVSGGHAYVPCSSGGKLAVVDVSDPANPALVGNVTIASAGAVAIVGDVAFVGALGLHKVDVSDPSSPQILGSAAHAAFLVDVATADGLLVVASRFNSGTGSDFLVTYDGAGATPVEQDAFQTELGGGGCAVEGGVAYQSYWQGFYSLDVSDPASISEIAKGEEPDDYSSGGAVALAGTVLAVAHSGNQTIALWDTASATVLGDVTDATYLSQVEDLAIWVESVIPERIDGRFRSQLLAFE